VSDYWEDPWLGGDGQTAYATVSGLERCPHCGERLICHDPRDWFCPNQCHAGPDGEAA
jgi:hypothetical protein